MKAIVTVIGRDRVGIIADVSRILAEQGVNVLDISQTVLQEYFTMIMLGGRLGVQRALCRTHCAAAAREGEKLGPRDQGTARGHISTLCTKSKGDQPL